MEILSSQYDELDLESTHFMIRLLSKIENSVLNLLYTDNFRPRDHYEFRRKLLF